MKKKDFHWFSLEQVNATSTESRGNVALIAISSTQCAFAEIEGYATALKLLFDDITPESVEGLWIPPTEKIELFSDSHANQIVDFVIDARARNLRTWIHCRMGISRSAAVAAALGTLFDDDGFDPFDRAWPNEHVYSVLMAVGKARGIRPGMHDGKLEDVA